MSVFDTMYLGNNDEQRRMDDLFILRYTVRHIIQIADFLYSYKEVLKSNDSGMLGLFFFLEMFNKRIQYLESFVNDDEIKEAIKILGPIKYDELVKDWDKKKKKLEQYLSFNCEDGITPCGMLFEVKDNEESVIHEFMGTIHIPNKKNQLLFVGEYITLNGRTEKLANSDTIQGVILKMAIKRNGKVVKDFEMQEQFEKNTKIMYDELKFNPSKTYSAAVGEINRKARDTLLIDFDLLIYEKKTVRLNDCVVVK